MLEALPNALYRVELRDRSAARRSPRTWRAARALLRLRPGDAVVVELMPYDVTRGRIVGRR